MPYIKVGPKTFRLEDVSGFDLHATVDNGDDGVTVLLVGQRMDFIGRGAHLLRLFFGNAVAIDGVQVIDLNSRDAGSQASIEAAHAVAACDFVESDN
jgi:hypothetical protein